MNMHEAKGFECKICREKFAFRTPFIQHYDSSFQGDFFCKNCGPEKSFHSKAKFLEHLQSEHQTNKAPCPFCDEIYTNATRFYSHLNDAHWSKQKPLTCSEDEKKEHDPSLIKCSLCSKTFTSYADLAEHTSNYHLTDQVGGLSCHICNYQIPSWRQYKYHMERHEYNLEKPFGCHDCGVFFNTKEYLKNHILSTHVSQDSCNFLCDKCDRRFATQKFLTAHLRSKHSEKKIERKPVICELCKKQYSSEMSLRTHMKTVHQNRENKFWCENCSFTTTKLR